MLLHDVSGLIVHDASGLVLHDVSGLVLHDVSGLILHDVSGLVLHHVCGLVLYVHVIAHCFFLNVPGNEPLSLVERQTLGVMFRLNFQCSRH